jgi:hypothetical protein
MPKITATLLFLLFACLAQGQANKNCEYHNCLKRAANFLTKNQLEEARREYSMAKIFAKDCPGVSDSLADMGLQDVIDRYKLQTKNAEKAKEEAIKQKKIAENALKEKEKAEKKTLAVIDKAAPLVEKYGSKEEREDFSQVIQTSTKVEPGDITSLPKNISDKSNENSYEKRKNTYNTLPIFIKSKQTVNSLMNLFKKGNLNLSEQKIVKQIEPFLKRLDSDISFNILAKHLLDSTKKELKNLKSGTSQFDFTVYMYLRSVLYYCWNLSLKGKDSLALAKTTLDEAAANCKSLTYKSAIVYSGMAGLYNSYNKYYEIINSTKLQFEAIKTALEYGTNAVRLNPGNYLYQRGLATLLGNTTYISDSLISLMDKVELARLSYRCLKNMEIYFPYSGNSLTELISSSTNLANRLMDIALYNSAADTLKNTIEILNQYISKKVSMKDVELNKLNLLVKTSGIYVDSINSFISGLKYLNESYTLCTAIKQDTINNADVDRLVELNVSLDNLLKYTKSKEDSLSTITTFSAAIQAYEKISPLSRGKYKTFSEDVYRFAQPYVRRLELNILRNNKEDADKDFAVLEKTIFPFYYKYRFDFYLGQPLIKASKVYANYLCGQGRYKQALPLLKFASLEGVKESTDSLVAIYQKTGFFNADSLKFYKNRTSYQSNGMKRFTVPTDFNGVKFPLFIYITDRAKEYDTLYTGIRDQVQWVWKARQGRIPDDVVSSFDKLQKIAWENNVSFMDLSVYALAAATNDSVKTKEYKNSDNLKKEIENKNILSLLTLSKQYAVKNNFVAIDTIDKEIKIKVADLYNSLGWENILLKKFDDAMFYITEGLKYDPNSVFLKGNVPHIELLTGNIEKAKRLYLSYKNDLFNKDYKTYKDAFLSDFQEFEKVGIINENIKEIIRLLNEK